MKYIHFFFCLLLGMAVQAQIKIGDNPQNIDPSSVLELESSSRVLVITRVNTAQMNAIIPSAGAMVYNTDIQCIHYYTGTEWKDICDAVAGSITFTSDDGTVVITSTGGNNYDLKVGQITGMNIVNETVFGADIATATIGERQLAPNSVGASELQDNTVGKDEIQEAAVGTLEIIDGTIQPSDMQPGAFDQILTTDAGGNVVWLNKNELGATQTDQTTITGAGTAADPIKVADTVIGDILANANNISQNSADIAANTTALGTKEDVANKSDDTNLGNSTTLYPTQNAVKTYVDLAAGAVSSLNSANIFVGNAGNVATGVAMSGDATINNTGVVTIANNAVTNDKLDKANIPLSGFGAAAASVSLGTNRLTNVANPTNPDDAATRAYVDAQVGGVGGTGDITSSDLTITGGINAAFNDVNLEITAGAVGTAELADNSVNSTKIIDGAVQTADIANNSVTPIKIESPGAPNQMLTTDGANAITWVPIAAGSTELADQVTIVGDGTSGNEFEVADNSITPTKIETPGAPNQMLTTDGTNTVTWIPITAGSTELADQITIIGDGTTGNEFEVANNSIAPVKIQSPGAPNQMLTTDGANAVTWVPIAAGSTELADQVTIIGDGTTGNEFEVADGAITSIKIANGTILAEDLNQMGAADGQILKWDITANAGLGGWILAEDRTDGTGIPSLSNGTILIGDVSNLPQERTVNGDATIDNAGLITIADQAITLPKLVNGTAAGQLIQWNGTDWVLVADTALTLTEADGIVGNEVTGAADATLVLAGAGTAVSPLTLDVAAGGITDSELADDAVTLPKMAPGTAAGQLMQWNGTDWVLVADTALTLTETDGIIGNEVTNVTNGTLIRSGTGTGADPYTLGIADLGVGTAQLTNNAVTSIKITDDNVTLAKLANGTAAGQLMQWNGTDWVLVADTALTLTEADGIIGNEVTNVTNATLARAGTGTAADPYTLGISNLGVDTAQLADNAVTSIKITDDNVTLAKLANGTAAGQLMQWNGTDWVLVADTALTLTEADGIIGNEVTNVTNATLERAGTGTAADPYTLGISNLGVNTAQLANNAVTSTKITDDNVTLAKLANGTAAGQLMQWNGTDWVLVADTALTLTEADGIVGNEVTNVTNATLERAGTGTAADPYTLGISNLGVNTAQLANDAVTSTKIALNTIVADDVATGAITSDEILNASILAEDLSDMGATTNGQVMKWNGTAWAPAADATGSAVTDADVNDGLSDFSATTGYNVNVDDTTVELFGDALRIKDNGVTSAKIALNTIVADDIATGAITSDEILNASILAEDLSAMGATTNGQVMKWNGTAWAPAADATGSAVTDADVNDGLSDFSATTGYNVNVDDTTVELFGDALRIKDNGVTSNKIALNTIVADDIATGAITSDEILNASILAEDLSAMGATTNGQVMKWNGTAWAPAADATGSAVTDADVNDGLSDFSATTGYNVNVDDTTVELFGDALRIKDNGVTSNKIALNTIVADDVATGAITSDEILNATILAEDLSAMGATTNGQVMKWNGTAWAPAADATGSAVTDADVNDGLSDFSATTGYNVNVDDTTVELFGDALRVKDGAITSAKIFNGTILSEDIANEAVEAANIKEGAVTSIKIANGTITSNDIGNKEVTPDKIEHSLDNGQVLTTVAGNVQWADPPSAITGTTGALFFAASDQTPTSDNTQLWWDEPNNKLYIGNPIATTADVKLNVNGTTRTQGIKNSPGSAGTPAYRFTDNLDTGMFLADASGILGFSANNQEAMRINASQNVGIGLTTILEKLHVDGNIRADGDFISNGTTLVVPDYVFQKYFLGNSSLKENYDFQTLAQIEAFLKENHHLPGIVSAKEAKAAGKWNLSESNLQNLEKIEELFLHTIEQEKKIDQLKNENQSLSAELLSLRKDMEEIKALLKNKN